MLTLQNLDHLAGKVVLITGGTGSLGKTISRILLKHSRVKKIIIFSRDELKQFEMRNNFKEVDNEERLRYFLGDIRDRDRCRMAFNDVDIIFHTAALKQVPAAEYNPFEFIKTNVIGSQNIIETSIEKKVSKVIALSTDKAANPINLYGSTKFCADKLFVAGNQYSGEKSTRFSVVRYGNVVGSRGSVIPHFLKLRKSGSLPITHPDMTRFWITLSQAAHFVINCQKAMTGEEIFVPKIPSMKVVDLAKVIGPDCDLKEIGIRPGEKLHEEMIPEETGRDALEYESHYVIKPSTFANVDGERWPGGKPCELGFHYRSNNNPTWMTREELLETILELDLPEVQEFKESL